MVIIKDMEMPKCCGECPLFHFYFDINGTLHYICKCGNVEMYGDFENERNDFCPLIENQEAEKERIIKERIIEELKREELGNLIKKNRRDGFGERELYAGIPEYHYREGLSDGIGIAIKIVKSEVEE